jgi:PAS domain-containing protein
MGLHQERHWIRQATAPASALTACTDGLPMILPALPAAWQCDLATEELRWTDGVFDLFGIARGAAIDRRSTLEFYLPDSRRMLDRLRSAALDTCGSFTFEAQIRRVDGELRWMRLNADVQKRDGRAVVLYGTKQDITAEMAG